MKKQIFFLATTGNLLLGMSFAHAAPVVVETPRQDRNVVVDPTIANRDNKAVPEIYQPKDQTDIYAIPLDNDALDDALEMQRLKELERNR